MQAGKLRHRVNYESLSQGSPTTYGDSAEVPGKPIPLWAEVLFLEGAEMLRAKQVHEQAKVRITIRYNSIVNATGRFVFQGENFYPASVIPDPRKIQMTCICYTRPQETVA